MRACLFSIVPPLSRAFTIWLTFPGDVLNFRAVAAMLFFTILTLSLLNNSWLDGRSLSVCWNPDCRCRLLLKSRRLPFSGFLPLDVSSSAVGDVFRSGRCRCVRCRGSLRTVSSSATSYIRGACILLLSNWPALGQLKPDWSVSISLLFVIRGFTLQISSEGK